MTLPETTHSQYTDVTMEQAESLNEKILLCNMGTSTTVEQVNDYGEKEIRYVQNIHITITQSNTQQ